MKKIFYRNHLIQKKLGQVFLHDKNIINSIVKIFNPKKHQIIIEIGPGLGALTQPILEIIDHIILIEYDSHLVNKLIQKFGNKKIKILNIDILTVNFFNFINQPTQKIRLIGNLPYNIATKLILNSFKYINIIYDMHFMLQKEVGKRITAKPNTKEYGRLSIITQYYCKIIPLLEVSKKSFIPIPQVESIMMQLIPYHNQNPYPQIDIKLLSLLTQLAFQQRRKTIQNSLSLLFNATEITQQNINIKSRAEDLTIHQYCSLTAILSKKLKQN